MCPLIDQWPAKWTPSGGLAGDREPGSKVGDPLEASGKGLDPLEAGSEDDREVGNTSAEPPMEKHWWTSPDCRIMTKQVRLLFAVTTNFSPSSCQSPLSMLKVKCDFCCAEDLLLAWSRQLLDY